MERRVCAFTGHRPGRFAFGYEQEHPDCTRLKNAIGKTIATLGAERCDHLYQRYGAGSRSLGGTGSSAAERGISGRLRLIAVQPCADQPQRWPHAAQREYQDILACCDERVCLHDHYTPHCMMERNRWMVDRADILLAVYDGSAGGGTAATVRYAQNKQKEIWLLDPDTLCLVALTPPEKQISFSDTFLSGQMM